MTINDEVHDFLRSRRARLTPDMVGLPTGGGLRRVPGLRREEVAMLAGVSVDYYNRFEAATSPAHPKPSSTHSPGPSASTRPSTATSTTSPGPPTRARSKRRPRATRTRPSAQQRRSDSMTGIPAFVQNGRLDVLAMNALARELYHQGSEDPQPTNFARDLFLDTAAPETRSRTGRTASTTDAILRQEAGRDRTGASSGIIGALTVGSAVFRRIWATHTVRFHRTGVKQFHHPAVGDFELSFEAMERPRPGRTHPYRLLDAAGLPNLTTHSRSSARSAPLPSATGPPSADRPGDPRTPHHDQEEDLQMSTWTENALARIGAAGELRIAGTRADGTLRNPVIIWGVRVGNEFFVRSVR